MELSTRLFAILSGLLEERTGLHYEMRDQNLFADKVAYRARVAGFESLLDYYYYLRYDPDSAVEFEELVNALVVTETYFFREPDALDVAIETLIGPVVRGGRRARVWCAACASGDEPLSLAMMLSDVGLLDGTDLVASDISLRAFENARLHGWGPRSLRALPCRNADRFIRVEGERGYVDERLVRGVDWRRVNLLDGAAVVELGTFDLILCRNVLIYFSDDTVQKVLLHLAGALRDARSRLLVGNSESLMRMGTLFDCEERSGSFLYARNGERR